MLVESTASFDAKYNNLRYIGFGRYINPVTKKLYISNGSKISPYIRKQNRLSYMNNVKSTLDNETFETITNYINKGKISYKEEILSDSSVREYFEKQGLASPDFIHAFVPKKIYLSNGNMSIKISFDDKRMLFICSSESDFYCEYIIKKQTKHYVCHMVALRLPDDLMGSEHIRKYVYNMVNFFNKLGVTSLYVKCGHTYGAYMWSRYGVNFVNSKERNQFLDSVKKHVNEEIINKANENEEFNKAIKKAYSTIVNTKTTWDISSIVVELSNSTIQYLRQRVDIDSFLVKNKLFLGKMLMIKTSFNGVLELFPDSKSYIQYYKYNTFKSKKSNLTESKNEMDTEEDKENILPSPYEIINKKMSDVKVWKQDKYDKLYEQQIMGNESGE